MTTELEVVVEQLTPLDELDHALFSGDPITTEGYRSGAEDYNSLGSTIDVFEADERRKERTVFDLGNLKAEGGYIHHQKVSGKYERLFPVDKQARKALGTFLNIPVPYLQRVGNTLADANIEWHFEEHPDVAAEFVTIDGELQEVRSPDSLSISKLEALRLIMGQVGADARIRRIDEGLNATTIDVIHPDVSIMPAHRIGDVTYGGLRIVLPAKNQAPKVGTYLHRLVCTNGATNTYGGDQFNIAGKSHDEILEHMEDSLSSVWNRVPEFLAGCAALADKPVSEPLNMIRVYAAEHGIAPRFTTVALDRAAAFMATETGAKHQWTLYDIMQLFTSLAHLPAAKENTQNKLMALGGHMIAASANERRCGQCSHLLITGEEHAH